MSLAPGTRLGPYEIAAPLGAGGMGEVYRARDTRLGRDVAVKVLPAHLSSSPEVRARFEREARAVSSLNHPHICTLHDVGREGDTDYLVMELVDGGTLADRLLKGPLPLAELLKVGAQIADGLDRAHRAGIVHRDLKPGNIMLTKSGAKLLDFGLARATGLVGGDGSDAATMAALSQSPTISQPLTAEGTIVGTFQYMSPEQLEGRDADARGDLWALGCVLYEMATGQRAFAGATQASLIGAIMRDAPRPLSELAPLSPPSLDRLVGQCLAKDPDDRWQNAGDLKRELQWIAESLSGSGVAAQVPAPKQRRRLPRGAVLPVLLAILAAAFVVGRRSTPHHEPPQVTYARKTIRTQAIFTARFMPDGKTAVISAAPEGNTTELFVIRPELPEPQSLGQPGVHLLGISSRGELAVLTGAHYLGHHRLFHGTLARMPLEGAAPREVLENVREADWSPDGEHLAIIHEVDGQDVLEFPIGTVLRESAGYLSDPRVSPDGRQVAFMEHPARYDDRGSVNVVDTEGHASELAAGFWGEEGLAWAPDSRTIYFSATMSGSEYVVYAVDLRGRLRSALRTPGGLVIHDIAADGRWLTTQDDNPIELTARVADASTETDLSWLDSSLNPIISPDASTVMFTDQSPVAGPNYGVCLRPLAGGAIVRLGEGAGSSFAPDGKSVLACVYSTPPKLMSYPVGAGRAARLDRGSFENLSDAIWLPDQRRILVSGNEPGKPPRCFLLDAADGTIKPVGVEGITFGVPAPDGRRFVARAQSGYAIFSLVDDRPPQPVDELRPTDSVIRWSADGSALLTYNPADIPVVVDRLDLATGRREPFLRLAEADRAGLVTVLTVALSNDLRSYVAALWRYESVLFLVDGAR